MIYKGMNAKTGRAIYDINHLNQSVKDILTTPLVSRLMRLNYGSTIFEFLDSPAHNQSPIQLYAAIATALVRFEPRLQLTRIQISSQANGQSIIDIEGSQLVNGQRKAVSLTTNIGVIA